MPTSVLSTLVSMKVKIHEPDFIFLRSLQRYFKLLVRWSTIHTGNLASCSCEAYISNASFNFLDTHKTFLFRQVLASMWWYDWGDWEKLNKSTCFRITCKWRGIKKCSFVHHGETQPHSHHQPSAESLCYVWIVFHGSDNMFAFVYSS